MERATSIAAQARARAEAAARDAEQAAASAAADRAKEKPAKIRPALVAAPPVPTISPARVSPAARRRAFVLASSAGAILAASGIALDETGANDDAELTGEVAKVVLQLQADRRALKEIKGTERKVAAKIGMLPAYAGWRDGVLAAGASERGPLDQVFTTLMAWTIDVGDYVTALPMVEHAVVHKLDMPSDFNRDPLTFAIDQICEDAIRAYDQGEDAAKTFPALVLPMLQDLVKDHDVDLHDEVEAKLHRALGMAILAGANPDDEDDLRQRRVQTLLAYQRAYDINPRVGVKKDMDRLKRELRKAVATDDQQADASPADDKAETNTPPSGG